ncbi:UL16-binding protein 2-like [Oryctolagus cuniculus]|uniref:UL16-binding protein 2-like n=1 Tax=Oryctolagus cuniculus TaxID=9986 RepID=UPI00387A7459
MFAAAPHTRRLFCAPAACGEGNSRVRVVRGAGWSWQVPSLLPGSAPAAGRHLAARAADSHSLCYNITVNPKARHGQQRCDVQGHVDDRRILHCDCSFTKISFFDPLGREVDAIDNWAEQTEMLRDVVDALNQQVAEMKHSTSKDPWSLQGRMCCQCGASGGRHGSWQFSFDGQIGLLFDPDARMWAQVHPGASWMKTTWENDRQLTEFLRKVSVGDCTRWLGNFLLPREEMLESTAQPPTTSGAVPSKVMATMPMSWTFLLLLTGSVLLVRCLH